jgi:hypothetical protein
MSDTARPAIVYVSWGGTGRGAAFREAYGRAAEENRGIVYLAILDAPTFGDLDESLLAMVTEELTWLLQAQVRLVDSEDRETHVGTRIVVRGGEVTMEVNELVKSMATDLVLIGAPVPLGDHGSVQQLVAALAERTGAQVEIVDPQIETAK